MKLILIVGETVSMHKYINYISLGEKTVGVSIKQAMKFKWDGGTSTWSNMIRDACLIICPLNKNLHAVEIPAMLLFVERVFWEVCTTGSEIGVSLVNQRNSKGHSGSKNVSERV